MGWFPYLSSLSSKVTRRGCVLSPSDELLSALSAWVIEAVACWSSLSDSDITAACVLKSMVLLKAIAGVSLSRVLQ